jgi:hypothetical protein
MHNQSAGGKKEEVNPQYPAEKHGTSLPASKKALASDLGLASRVQGLGGGNISRTGISFDPESSVLAAKHCLPKTPM